MRMIDGIDSVGVGVHCRVPLHSSKLTSKECQPISHP